MGYGDVKNSAPPTAEFQGIAVGIVRLMGSELYGLGYSPQSDLRKLEQAAAELQNATQKSASGKQTDDLYEIEANLARNVSGYISGSYLMDRLNQTPSPYTLPKNTQAETERMTQNKKAVLKDLSELRRQYREFEPGGRTGQGAEMEAEIFSRDTENGRKEIYSEILDAAGPTSYPALRWALLEDLNNKIRPLREVSYAAHDMIARAGPAIDQFEKDQNSVEYLKPLVQGEPDLAKKLSMASNEPEKYIKAFMGEDVPSFGQPPAPTQAEPERAKKLEEVDVGEKFSSIFSDAGHAAIKIFAGTKAQMTEAVPENMPKNKETGIGEKFSAAVSNAGHAAVEFLVYTKMIAPEYLDKSKSQTAEVPAATATAATITTTTVSGNSNIDAIKENSAQIAVPQTASNTASNVDPWHHGQIRFHNEDKPPVQQTSAEDTIKKYRDMSSSLKLT